MRKVSKKQKPKNLTFHLMEPEKEEQSRRRQIIKIRVRINEIEIG